MSEPIRESKTVTEHRWFEYGRWFNGFGSSMDDHRHDENCQWRSRTVVTETGPWTDWTTGPTPAEPCPYRAHYGEPCNCEARLAVVVTHTRASTPVGPDYCAECSEAVSEWMPWPCPATRPTPAPTEES